MVVDSHIHWPVCKLKDPRAFMRLLDSYGIDQVLLMGWSVLWKVGNVSDCNDQLVEFCNKEPQRLHPLATVHLAEGKIAISEAWRCLEKLNVRGFKLHPWVQGENIFRDEMYCLCQLAADFKVPIVLHDGTPPYSLPSQIGALAKMFPDTVFVLGHGGLLFYWEEAIAVVSENTNVYLCLCGQHPLAMQRICEVVDVQRVMFGTDCLGPGSEELIAYAKGLVESLDMDYVSRKKIMSDNAVRLFGLNSKVESGTQE